MANCFLYVCRRSHNITLFYNCWHRQLATKQPVEIWIRNECRFRIVAKSHKPSAHKHTLCIADRDKRKCRQWWCAFRLNHRNANNNNNNTKTIIYSWAQSLCVNVCLCICVFVCVCWHRWKFALMNSKTIRFLINFQLGTICILQSIQTRSNQMDSSVEWWLWNLCANTHTIHPPPAKRINNMGSG